MFPCDQFFGVDDRLGCLSRTSRDRQGLRLVGFKDLEAAELLVDEGERLEALRFEDLLVEPRLDFVLLGFGEFLVDVVDVTV